MFIPHLTDPSTIPNIELPSTLRTKVGLFRFLWIDLAPCWSMRKVQTSRWQFFRLACRCSCSHPVTWCLPLCFVSEQILIVDALGGWVQSRYPMTTLHIPLALLIRLPLWSSRIHRTYCSTCDLNLIQVKKNQERRNGRKTAKWQPEPTSPP